MIETMKREFVEAMQKNYATIAVISKKIHALQEVGFEEQESAAFLTHLLEENGFAVERNLAGLPTAFRATYQFSNTGPCLALMAEYDALPKVGHACGHNLIASAAVGAAIAISKIPFPLSGRLILFGTPAEEGGGGKVILGNSGYFDGVDSVVYFHPSVRDDLYGSTLACRWYEATYLGTPAHVQINPAGGKNALLALSKAIIETENLMKTFAGLARIGSIVTKGGENPFIIPSLASAEFLLSAEDDNELEVLGNQFRNLHQKIADTTGCSLDLKETMHYPSVSLNNGLMRVIEKQMTGLGLQPEQPSILMISTDCGTTSQVCPFAGFRLNLGEGKTFPHTVEFTELAGSDKGIEVAFLAAQIQGLTLLELFASPDLLKAVKVEYKQMKN